MTARKIIAALMLQGVKQIDIARRFGVSKAMIHQVVYGRSKSRRIQMEIARIIGEDVDEIWPRQEVA